MHAVLGLCLGGISELSASTWQSQIWMFSSSFQVLAEFSWLSYNDNYNTTVLFQAYLRKMLLWNYIILKDSILWTLPYATTLQNATLKVFHLILRRTSYIMSQHVVLARQTGRKGFRTLMTLLKHVIKKLSTCFSWYSTFPHYLGHS